MTDNLDPGASNGSLASGKKPNILILMADQHAPQYSGPYGHPLVQTPNLDRLAQHGVVFENAYSPSPICVPARMAFMTGKNIQHIGIWDNGVPLAEDEPTWAHHLRKSGYSVALSGKMHFRGHDRLHGFDSQLGIDMNSLNRPNNPDWSKELKIRREPLKKIGCGPGWNSTLESDVFCTDRAIDYLGDASRKNSPWTLLVGFVLPHPPLKAPQEYYDRYPHKYLDMPLWERSEWESLHPFHKRALERMGVFGEPLDASMIQEVRATYYAMISYLDHQIGRLMAALEREGLWDNTVIIYTSDHGEMLGEHLRWNKMCYYEQAVRIPLIVSRPADRATKRSQRRVSQNVSLIDLSATITDLAGVVEPEHLRGDGRSLANLLDDKTDTWDNYTLSELYNELNTRAPTAMIKRDNIKLNYYHGETPELFDLSEDSGETNNLAGISEYSQVQRSMTEELLSRWNPEEISSRILESQRKRHYLKKYLFPYIDVERGLTDSRFTGDLNR